MTLQQFQATVSSPEYWLFNLGALTGNMASEFGKQFLIDAFKIADPMGKLLLSSSLKVGIQMGTLYGASEIPPAPGGNEAAKFIEGMGTGAFSTIGQDIVAYSSQAQTRAAVYTSPVALFTSAWARTLMAPGYLPSQRAPAALPAPPSAPGYVPGEPQKRTYAPYLV